MLAMELKSPAGLYLGDGDSDALYQLWSFGMFHILLIDFSEIKKSMYSFETKYRYVLFSHW